MGSEWRKVKVSEVCSLIVDCVNKTAPTVEYETPYRVIRTPNIRNGYVEKRDLKFVTEETYRAWTRRAEVLDGDVLLTREAPMGEVGLVRGNDTIFLGQRVMQYRANPKLLDSKFLLYSFLSEPLQNQFRSHGGSGSVVDHIRVPDCSNFVLNLPPLTTQHQIAAILSAFDDKIELNRRMNRTLEQMARALFKSWFVDFDPVRSKMRGEMPEGMDAETAALFPDGMEEVDGREVPRGWTETTIGNITEAIFSGGTPDTRKPEYWDGNIPWFSSGETRNSFIIDTERNITSLGVHNSSTRLSKPGDVLIASAGQGFTRGQTSFNTIMTYINQSVVAVRSNYQHASSNWTYLNLSDRYEEMRSISDGHSSRGSLTTRLIAQMKVVLPPRQLITAFDNMAAQAVQAQIQNVHESARLAQLRDALLPRLLSGEVDVSTLPLHPEPRGEAWVELS